jgi:chemotaxis protein histidine kinase CheA
VTEFNEDDEIVHSFFIESSEKIQIIITKLNELNSMQPGQSRQAIDVIFRHIHSIKAMANLLKMKQVESMAESMESFLFTCRENNIVPSDHSLGQLKQIATKILSTIRQAVKIEPSA